MILASRTLSLSIDCHPDTVYEFVSNPENLPKWATGLGRSIRKSNGDWIVETSRGPMKVRFVEKNHFGVLDHFVTSAPGVEVYVPMRVVPNGSGSEILLTVFRSPEMLDEQYAADIKVVERDLEALKNILER